MEREIEELHAELGHMREELHAVAVEVDEKASGAIVASHELLVRGALEQSAAAQSEVP